MQDIVEYWEKSNLLEGVKDKEKAARFLENQKAFNSTVSVVEKLNISLYKTLSIPLVSRLCVEFELFNLINFDVMNAPTQNVSFKDPANQTKEFDMVAKTRFLKTHWNQDRLKELYDSEEKDEAELKFFLEFYDQIFDELQAEIIKDLSNNVGEVHDLQWKNAATLLDFLLIKSRKIERVAGRPAEWVIIPIEIYKELVGLEEFAAIGDPDLTSFKIQEVGRLFNKLSVYLHPQMEDLEIIIGNKGCGYYYYPYVLMSAIMHVPETDQEFGFFSRYSKKMFDNNNYSKIIISGYSFKKEV